ncbi:MAG: ABC transporter permease subunit [Parcubacteria group bacterium]|nr:ABC transporter permease subunit [Parcubacteria group bacterium]
MRNSHAYLKIYKRRVHLLITLLVVALPFLFTFFLSPLTNAETAVFLKNLGVSAFRLAIAYLISLAVALIFAFLLLRGRLENFFLPFFDVLQSFPTFAILPLAVYFIGASEITVILFLVLTVIWPILFAVASSLKLARRDWEEAAKI